MRKKNALKLVWVTLAAFLGRDAVAHAVDFWGVLHPLEWRNTQISEVVVYGDTGQKVSIEGKDCLTGYSLNFNVRDEYAFDIDETVWLDLEFHVESVSSELTLTYDRNDVAPVTFMGGEPDARVQLRLPTDRAIHWYRESVPLSRARFANLGLAGADFSIQGSHKFTICSLSMRRSYETSVARTFGWIALEVLDERGQHTPARVGIYDQAGRMPLPNDEAVTLKGLNTANRVLALRLHASAWPIKNRSVFYIDGQYHARLPVGEYELVVSKGPEYRFARQRFAVTANNTRPIKVRLRRWINAAAEGWYSGEGHIHYARHNGYDDHNVQLFAQAEDLRVANVLQMGNIANTYFHQHDWTPLAADRDPSFVVVPGQEDPRTSLRGHSIQWNIKAPVRNLEHYLLYHETFEKAHRQGGLVGYAHVNEDQDRFLNAARGMAIDVPFGIVDFAEVLSLHYIGVSIWFDFLNLGYKLTPSAGTDYPWGDVPGAVRNYVKIDGRFTPQAWFDAFKNGRTFVTSGPMVEMDVNGNGMGSEIHVRRGEPLVIKARASINPDIDELVELELIEQGTTVKSVAFEGGVQEIDLHYDSPARHGTWFVLRARGKRDHILAMSAPIYVSVDQQGFWKPSEVPSIVEKLREKMQELLNPNQSELIEAWETREPGAKYWDAQQAPLRERISRANAIYDDLVRRAAASAGQ